MNGDVNFKSDNIKNGVSIWGVTGSYVGQKQYDDGFKKISSASQQISFYINGHFSSLLCLNLYSVSKQNNLSYGAVIKNASFFSIESNKINFQNMVFYDTDGYMKSDAYVAEANFVVENDSGGFSITIDFSNSNYSRELYFGTTEAYDYQIVWNE